ncbi:MAG TPA: serine hydrolase domain-containing protein [Ideonella sp.]|uniref:serine hydrolase domain-containing protein n=1 Tax=Ideonella sp. TaxID=1929293 RepID=UPI002CB6D3F5|nr:serine hydrolase domain-containing protein [Ideonella sp.]HSI48745.1 serine hydrolase domain-containing protein [Ideonella sp.]
MALVSCAVPPNRPASAPIDNIVKNDAAAHGIPAQAVVVLQDGETVYRQYLGTTAINDGFPVNEETVFPVFSAAKLFAATLLLQLVDDGRVLLDAPASRYVADLPPSWRAITVEQFLDHVSGIPEYFDAGNLEKPFPSSLHAVFERLSDEPFVDRPGTKTRYTSTNFLVIEAILESVTGRGYRDLVNDRIIVPLGLKNTWLGLDGVPRDRLVADYHGENDRVVPDIPIAWPAYSVAHGNIYSTASDMATFLAAVTEGRFVSRDTLVRRWKPYSFPNGAVGYFASGWEYGKSGVWNEVGHDGGAKVRARILFKENLSDSYVIVYLTNGSRDNVWSRTLLDSVQGLVLPQ